MIREAIAKLVDGQDLSAEEAERTLGAIMAGEATPAQIAAFLTALRMKGETVQEILGCARAMRKAASGISGVPGPLVDTCGTGGDGKGTFNISTVAAFVVAGAGIPVAKHGNRAITSRCGSADLLTALGVNLDLAPHLVQACLEEVGIAFLYAPHFHPAMKHAALPRKEIGIRTVFNLLGPLTNPAKATVQVMGVYDSRWVEPLAHVHQLLGTLSAMVVYGADGLDEFSPTGPNKYAWLRNGTITTGFLDPRDLRILPVSLSELSGGDPRRNGEIAREILSGEPGAHREAVVLNAGAALLAAGKASDWDEAIGFAEESLASGNAGRKLEALCAFTNRG